MKGNFPSGTQAAKKKKKLGKAFNLSLLYPKGVHIGNKLGNEPEASARNSKKESSCVCM